MWPSCSSVSTSKSDMSSSTRWTQIVQESPTGQVAIDGRRYQPMELLIIPNPSFSSHVDFDRVCQQHLTNVGTVFVRDRKIRQGLSPQNLAIW